MESKIGPQIFATLSGTSIFINVGFQFGWPSPSLPKLRDKNSDLYVTSDQSSWIVSLMTVGSIFGSLLATVVVDRWGRKLSLMLSAIPMLLSCFLIAVAQNYPCLYVARSWPMMIDILPLDFPMLLSCFLIAVAQNYPCLYVARFTGGLGTGAAYTIMPMYLGEIADNRIRGALSSILTAMVLLGIVLTYAIGPWVNRIHLAAIGSVVPFLFLSTFAWVPDTPYYHIMRNKEDQAEKSLAWLRGRSNVKDELAEVVRNVNLDRRNRGTFRELITGPGNRKALVIVGGLICAQQLSGVEAVMSYASRIFESSGSTLTPSISVIIMGLIMFFSSTLGVLLVDKVGRRPLLMFSVCFNILFLTGEALYSQLQAFEVDVTAISWLPLTAIFGFMVSQPIGLGDLPSVILTEMFPCNVKAIAVMVLSVWCSVFASAVTKLYQVISDAYGIHASFWFFVVCECFFAIFIFFRVPETKGRSLRDIQDELLNRTTERVVLEKLNA